MNMKRIIIIFALLFVAVCSVQSQSLKDFSGSCDLQKSTDDESVYFNLKKSGYDYQSGIIQNMFSLNTKITYFYLRSTYSALGLTTELQYNVSDLTSLLFTFNPLIRNNSKSSSYGKFLFNLSLGSKFYFTDKKSKPYFSINAGLFKEPNIKAYFTISPVFGLDYFLNKLIDFNLEIKSNIHNSGLSIGIPTLTFSFNGGVNFKL